VLSVLFPPQQQLAQLPLLQQPRPLQFLFSTGFTNPANDLCSALVPGQ
jgi:hypothetical protein